MKKILLLSFIFLYSLCFTGCSDTEVSSQISPVESSEIVQSEINKTQFDSENDNEYVYADFEKYNSPAEENGLGGKKIYFDAIAVSIDENIDDIYILDVENNDGNKWVCSTRKNDRLKSELNAVIGKEIQVYGEYLGFSEKKKCPGVLIDYIIIDQKKTCIFATEEEALEYAEQYAETTENTTANDFDIEKLKKQADDVFVNSIGQEYYLIKSDGAIAFNTFLDTNKEADDIIEQIILGITLCWSHYCIDNYSIMSFMFFDLDGNNICYYTITNMFGNFSDLGNDIVWTEKYQQYQEVYNNSTYRDHLNIFKPKNQ